MRILLAEDEISLASAIVSALKKHNYSADAVHNGLDALARLETGEYDAAILDIMMPGIDGVTVLKTLREHGNTLPVIMLTAKSELEDKILCFDNGANDYITKPFYIKELLARIRVVCRTQQHQVSQISFGNITLDHTTFSLSSPSGSFYLTNNEFQMMDILLSNPRLRISSQQFFKKIWGKDSDIQANVVWVYISYLRKKLAALHSNIEINYYKSEGYALEEQTCANTKTSSFFNKPRTKGGNF